MLDSFGLDVVSLELLFTVFPLFPLALMFITSSPGGGLIPNVADRDRTNGPGGEEFMDLKPML